MAQSASVKKIKVATTDTGPFAEVLGLDTASLTQAGDLLDDTTFANNAGYRSRFYGLRDYSLSLSGNYEGSDTTGQKVIIDAWMNKTPIYIEYLPDGTTGLKGKVVVENVERSGAVADKEAISFSLQAAGPLASV